MAFGNWIEIDTITGAVAVFTVKEMLVAAGWTVESSSDGTTYNASGDEISSGAAGAGGLDNTNAWFRISNPDGVEYVVQRVASTTVYRVKVSAVAGFSGGTPGATQVPSATEEFVVLGTGTDASPTGETWQGVNNSYRLKGGADDASPYHFYAFGFDIGGGTGEFVWVHEGLTAGEAADVATFQCVLGGNGLADGNLNAETASGNATRCYATQPSAAPTSADWDIFCALTYESAGAQVIPVSLSTSPISTNDLTFPIPYARRDAISNPGWKGVGSTMRWNGNVRATGDTFTVDSTRDRIVCDDVNLPWQGTVPTV